MVLCLNARNPKVEQDAFGRPLFCCQTMFSVFHVTTIYFLRLRKKHEPMWGTHRHTQAGKLTRAKIQALLPEPSEQQVPFRPGLCRDQPPLGVGSSGLARPKQRET